MALSIVAVPPRLSVMLQVPARSKVSTKSKINNYRRFLKDLISITWWNS